MKPFLTYVGSKQKVLKKISKFFPDSIGKYYEPFVGGGSVFLHINNIMSIEKNFINDIDKDIISIYKIIKKNPENLIDILDNIQKLDSKKDFMKMLDLYNNKKIDNNLRAALHIYLSKKSFNGNLQYRSNKQTKARYSLQKKSLKIYNNENIMSISKLLKKTKISNMSYSSFLAKNKPKKGDFVYLDPPYIVSNVKQYYKSTFDENEYINLKKECDNLNEKGVNFMITLNSHPFLKKLFSEYNIQTWKKKYSGMSNGRIYEKEIIITNY